MKFIILLLLSLCVFAQNPTGALPQAAITGLGPGGHWLYMQTDVNGNLELATTQASSSQGGPPGFVPPYAMVGKAPDGTWRYLQTDVNGNLMSAGGGGGIPSSPPTGATPQVIYYPGTGTTGNWTSLLSAGIASLSASNTFSANGAASTPAMLLSGTWNVSGTSTTVKPQALVECNSGTTTSTGWNTAGTGLGVNACSGFTGNLLDLQVNGVSAFKVGYDSQVYVNNTFNVTGGTITTNRNIIAGNTSGAYYLGWAGADKLFSPVTGQLAIESNAGGVGIAATATGDVSACYNGTSFQLTYGSVCGSSLAKFKENVSPITNGLAQIMALNPVTFDWRKDSGYASNSVLGMHDVGMIADETAAVNPLFGAWNPDGSLQNFRDRAILATLVKAVQEQQSEIEDLKKAQTGANQ